MIRHSADPPILRILSAVNSLPNLRRTELEIHSFLIQPDAFRMCARSTKFLPGVRPNRVAKQGLIIGYLHGCGHIMVNSEVTLEN